MLYEYPDFSNKNEIVDYLNNIKDQFDGNVTLIDEEYKDYLDLLLRRLIPNSFYYDHDILAMIHDTNKVIIRARSKHEVNVSSFFTKENYTRPH